jgi:hypothetical protein
MELHRQDKTRRMHFACRIIKDTDTHSEYAILIALHAGLLRTQTHTQNTQYLLLYMQDY